MLTTRGSLVSTPHAERRDCGKQSQRGNQGHWLHIERAQGDVEVRVVFHVDHLGAVLALLKPYRRRQVSEAERGRLAAIGAAFRYGPGDGVQSDFTALESAQDAADGKSSTAA